MVGVGQGLVRVWVADSSWPSRSSTPDSTASASSGPVAGPGWVPGLVAWLVVAV